MLTAYALSLDPFQHEVRSDIAAYLALWPLPLDSDTSSCHIRRGLLVFTLAFHACVASVCMGVCQRLTQVTNNIAREVRTPRFTSNHAVPSSSTEDSSAALTTLHMAGDMLCKSHDWHCSHATCRSTLGSCMSSSCVLGLTVCAE